MIDAHDGCILGNAHSIAYSVSITLITIPLLRHSRAPLGKKVMWAHTFFVFFSSSAQRFFYIFWLMKRIVLLFSVFLLVLNSFAQGDFEYNGIWYNYLEEGGQVEVAGSWNYNYNYRGDIVIPEIVSYGNRVTGVGENAFRECRDLTSVTLPEGITYIGDGAFFFCDNLLSVNIPEGVMDIGEGAFYQCINLGAITIPASVNSIGLRAFVSCMLTSITVDENNFWWKWYNGTNQYSGGRNNYR